MERPPSSEKVPDIEVRHATESDIEGILAVQRDTWIATYPNEDHQITKEDIEAKDWDAPTRAERWVKIVAEHNSNIMIWVAKDTGKVIGFARGSKSDAENELQALYILPEYQGKGVGTKLMQEFITWADPDKDTTLGVVTYNANAISFYKKFGFEEGDEILPGPGHIPDLPSGKTIPEMKMTRSAR
jgi:GNAT superfamily N-acetyltransferase